MFLLTHGVYKSTPSRSENASARTYEQMDGQLENIMPPRPIGLAGRVSKVKSDKLTADSIHVSSGNAEHYFVKCVVNCVLTSNRPAVDYFMQILLYRVVGLVTGCVPQAGYASSMLIAACLALLYAYY